MSVSVSLHLSTDSCGCLSKRHKRIELETPLTQSTINRSINQQVHAVAMSPAMRVHTLVAVATDDRRVRLCDLKSGGACVVCDGMPPRWMRIDALVVGLIYMHAYTGSSHLLMGHTEAVLTAAWSPTQEHLLATVTHTLK